MADNRGFDGDEPADLPSSSKSDKAEKSSQQNGFNNSSIFDNKKTNKVDIDNTSIKSSEKNDDDKESKGKKNMVSFSDLFRFGDGKDKLLLSCGILFALLNGAMLPLMIIAFGGMTDTFVHLGANATYNESTYNEEAMLDAFITDINKFTIMFVILGVAAFGASYVQVACFVTTSERQAYRMRTVCFDAVLKQEIGWFDTHPSGEITTRLNDDVNKVKGGIGDKLGQFFQFFSTFIAGFIVGFVYGWELTLVILCVSPLLAICGAVMVKMMTSATSHELDAYAQAGSIAEEVLSSIRTVVAYGGESKEVERYTENLKLARTPVFFGVLIGAFSLGNAAPAIGDIATARGAAYTIWSIIDQDPSIDSSSKEGDRPKIEGNVQLEDVEFQYPSRPDIQVLKGISLTIDVGQTVALVGSSGSGKSTAVQLIQRFYDVMKGCVKVDGKNIKDMNVTWLRNHIGVVSQEPVLFGTTIAENIRYGREDVTMEEIERACQEANAYEFICKLPDRYDTLVGERGAALSGGQKQRIAIARALVRDPKILLLDEATSALDTESEATVQVALDKASVGRTTLVIAHRLSTIRNADKICAMQDGIIVEEGTHDELMAKQGLYYELVMMQSKKKDNEENVIDDDLEDEAIILKSGSGSFKRSLSARGSDRKLKRALSSASKKSDAEADNEGDSDLDEAPEVSMKRIMKMNSPEWPYILFGTIAAAITGACQPAFAIVFAKVIVVFALPEDEILDAAAPLCAAFAILGVIQCFSMIAEFSLFGKSGEELTLRLRFLAFTAILKQEIGWFDQQKNSTGALTTKLASEASAVQGAAGRNIAMVVQAFFSLGIGIFIAFFFGWQMTLVVLLCCPLLVVAGFLHASVLKGFANKDKDSLQGAGKIASEAVENIRTVASLTVEGRFSRIYADFLFAPYEGGLKNAHIYGLTYGFSQGVTFLVNAAAFRFGAFMIEQGEMTFEDVFLVFALITFGAMAVGQASSFAPDAAKAKVAANQIFFLLDRESEIDTSSTEGLKPEKCISELELHDVRFRYPTRPDVPVLRGVDLKVNPGQRVALVGSSGCGKSTIVQLTERFYDTIAGSVALDGNDLKDLNIQSLRQQLGIVSQEPILFDRTIKDNIAYGDNSREVPMNEIIQAAKDANIHGFVQSLPLGYDTRVGEKGTQLSGGQKQRVAIARALVRNPKILLLDEATSALDTESEKIVQDALDRASEGRTCIVIAHRLSTIQEADKIVVIQNGKIVEEGKHGDLLNRQGVYYRLNNAQLATMDEDKS
uniref:Multidrug resistance protein 1-like n=1 Tax=Saccoglossus kowalevskii TaxID=10224 RepID=A0ABM0M3F7_SACKO|nr:PREDICTED: multidrug resistance protein 1-like [Saccoglossus kowalevskii]